MTTVRDILDYLCELAPPGTAEPWDNVGLLAGFPDSEVGRALVALDITDEVIAEAAKTGCALLVSHHPLFIEPLRRVTADDPASERVVRLLRGGLSAVCMHTNLDAAAGGVNDCLAQRLGLTGVAVVPGSDGVLRAGLLPAGTLPAPADGEAFARFVRGRLGCPGVRYRPSECPVRRVAVGGGACGKYIAAAAAAGCDAFVSADLKYDAMLEAGRLGLLAVDAGHFFTEDVVCEPLVRALSARFPEVAFTKSARHSDPVRFV